MDRLAVHVRAGASLHAAAVVGCGIPETTWYRWKRQWRAGDGELGALFGRLERAQTARRDAERRPLFDPLASDPEYRAFFGLDRAARDP